MQDALERVHGKVRRAKASGIGFVILRPNGFMQNTITYLAPSIEPQGVLYDAITVNTSYIDVRDVAAVAAKTLAADEHAGNLRVERTRSDYTGCPGETDRCEIWPRSEAREYSAGGAPESDVGFGNACTASDGVDRTAGLLRKWDERRP